MPHLEGPANAFRRRHRAHEAQVPVAVAGGVGLVGAAGGIVHGRTPDFKKQSACNAKQGNAA